MISKVRSLFFLPLILIFLKSAEGASGSIGVPSNVQLKALPDARKQCVVFQWTSSCKSNDSVCRTTLKLTKKIDNGVSTLQTKNGFIPHTAADNITHYQCIYDGAKENSTCCSAIVPGLKGEDAMQTTLGSADVIEMELKICLNYSGNCVSNPKPYSFVSPWKDACRLMDKPCGTYGNCIAVKANQYNCTCITSDWEGRNCSSLKGATVFRDRCVPMAITAMKTEANRMQPNCLLHCKNLKDCKSFVFTPDSAGSRTGNCKWYSGNSQDYKLESCPGKWFVEIDRTSGSTGGMVAATTSSIYLMIVTIIAHMVFL